ncbi:MAG: hypothetical protein ACI8QF_002838 [Limisphaerales bacterium]
MIRRYGGLEIASIQASDVNTLYLRFFLKKKLTIQAVFGKLSPHTESQQEILKHMKLKAVLLAGAICLTGALTSSAQVVYSANTVGFVNKEIPTGFSMVANPVIAADNTIAALFADADPGFRVFKFDAVAGAYTIFIKTGPTTWVGPADTATLVPGEGAFVSNPGAMMTLTFAGEVATGGASNMAIGAGFSIVSSTVAQGGMLQTDLGFPATPGDRVFLFDSGSQSYSIRIFTGASWVNGEPDVEVGDAFFVNLVNPATWTRDFDPNAAP